MPPVPPSGSHQTRFTTLDRAQRVRFRRAVSLMLMTFVLPGSAQLVYGNRRVGRIALRTWLAFSSGSFRCFGNAKEPLERSSRSSVLSFAIMTS